MYFGEKTGIIFGINVYFNFKPTVVHPWNNTHKTSHAPERVSSSTPSVDALEHLMQYFEE